MQEGVDDAPTRAVRLHLIEVAWHLGAVRGNPPVVAIRPQCQRPTAWIGSLPVFPRPIFLQLFPASVVKKPSAQEDQRADEHDGEDLE